MRVLVTGGCGFIGSNFIRYMLKNYPDCEITNLDKLTYCGNLENLRDIEDDERYHFVKGDICDEKLVNELAKRVEIIINFAAESHVDRSIINPIDFLKTNILGTFVLLESAKKYNLRFHQISTDEVMGSLDLDSKNKFDENTSYKPRSPYSASKASADHLVNAYFHTFKVRTTISNCSNNYGEYQFPEKLIPLAITNLLEGKKIPIYGDGLNIRDWIYVIDHCRAIDLIIRNGKIGETYCVGGDCEKKNIEVAEIILKNLGLGKEHIEFVKDRAGHDRRYAINSEKIKHLGWKQEYDFETGIKKTIGFYKNNRAWWEKLKEKAKLS